MGLTTTRSPPMTVFTPCACSVDHLGRIERRRWMKVFWWMRAYLCDNCGKVQLLSQVAVDQAKAAYAARTAHRSFHGKKQRSH